jgi:cation diffusion facilitator CzcD-associated flavoprotein CzcO
MPEGVHVDDPPRRPREHAGLIVAPHVAIVGAGVRGLASAVYLRSRGYGITIFEQASTCGGMWTRVYDTSFINTPNHGYTFHPGNR